MKQGFYEAVKFNAEYFLQTVYGIIPDSNLSKTINCSSGFAANEAQ